MQKELKALYASRVDNFIPNDRLSPLSPRDKEFNWHRRSMLRMQEASALEIAAEQMRYYLLSSFSSYQELKFGVGFGTLLTRKNKES